ncbi:MAG: molecular chaperone HtpG [Ruminococcaceae bacterium]|nr:molecular chaperone HtpG [Oscillospiraceae bacterium]
MAKKQFKTESKKLLDMMVNSIYTNKEIFLRELISNASDAIDKSYFASLTDGTSNKSRNDYEIRLTPDKETRTLKITDNGCGMTKDELDNNLGVIAKSGSFDFKNNPENKDKEEIDIIGQFGVGFYSAFMVSDKITVESRAHGADEAYVWESEGADGYTISPCEKAEEGTVITLYIKADTEDEKYSEFLEEYKLRMLIKKYSDYIRYPIRMLTENEQLKEGSKDEYEKVTEDETLNSMIPLWKKPDSEVTEEEYANFYKEKYYDYEAPLKTIRQKAEGGVSFEAMLFIPSHAPFDYYSKNFEKGLQLYSSGVMIMEKCKDLLPDYFSFVHGLVDSSDLSLNISREMLQQDRQLKAIAKSVEKKIAAELKKMLDSDREGYEKFYTAFGTQLKWGLYSDYGMHKSVLQDLLMFKSSKEKKLVTLHEYVSNMTEEQKKIYFATGDSIEKISLLPQVESVISRGYEVLYLTEDVDEFALQILHTYEDKEFLNVCKENLDISTDEEKEALKKENEASKEMLDFIKESIGESLHSVRFSSTLGNHPATLSSEGEISVTMEKTLNRMPGAEENQIKAELVLELNLNHPISEKLKSLYSEDKDKLAKYSKIIYSNARLISGLSLNDPSELASLVCELMVE